MPDGDSPFLAIPASEWLAVNRSAFVIADRFPAGLGHALVVPRRVIATWWEASGGERADMLALVDEVKRRLDAELQPDGYNVGFNAGLAAGQTVGHLHIHVIPRYRGDVPDPRGGMRHVIPGKGQLPTARDTATCTGRRPGSVAAR
jgi:diadenosine tetraphosphate (Ap4A) HIT family hydrolase